MEKPKIEKLESMTKQKKEYIESNAGDGTEAIDQYLHGYKLFLTLLSVVLTLFASALDQTIVATILSDVGDEFSSFEKIGWLTSGYMLPMATFAPSWGKVSIAFGRKYTMLSGLFFFFIGSLIAALAKNMDMLIGARVIQGIGGGAIQAMTMVILSEVVPVSKRALSMTLIGITFSVASALGPFIGGSFSTHVTWRWCFWINLPISGLGAAFLLMSFNPPRPEGDLKQKLAKIDYLGTFLISSGLILVLLALTFGGQDFPWRSAAIILCFVLGGLLLIVFCVWNFGYSKNPIIIKEAITTLPTLMACIGGLFAFIQFIMNTVYLAIFFQVVQGASAWQSGIDLLPFIITVPIVSVANGFFLRVTRLVKVSFMLCAISAVLGSGLLLLLDENVSYGRQFGVLVINGIAAGLSFQSSLLSAQISAPTHIPGSMIIVTTFNNFCKSVGGVIGVVIGQLILQTVATKEVREVLNSLDEAADLLHGIDISSIISNPQIVEFVPSSIKNEIIKAYVTAIHNIFYFSIAVSGALVVFATFSTNRRIPADDEVANNKEKDNESLTINSNDDNA